MDNDFVGRLADPVDWLNGVIRNFAVYGFDPETCTIRTGVTGSGAYPNYKIEESNRPTSLVIGDLSHNFTHTLGRTFNGRHHAEMTELDDLERRDENWSAVISIGDAKAMLADVQDGS